MDFSEYAKMLYPECGGGDKPSEFITALIGRSIEIDDDADDKCDLLSYKRSYLQRIYNGKRQISQTDASLINSHFNRENFRAYILESATVDAVAKITEKLLGAGISTNGTDSDVIEKCANLLMSIMDDIAQGRVDDSPENERLKEEREADKAERLLEEAVAAFSRPPELTPPEEIEAHEHLYINELYAAYGDAENVDDFCESHLPGYTQYAEDLKDRRIDYFAAESIRRGLDEVYGGTYVGQFDAQE